VPNSTVIINFVLFQLAWFACVLGAARDMPWLGVIVTVAIVVWHLRTAKQAKPEIFLLIIVLAIGALFDQMMHSTHLLTYQAHGWSNALVPAWILALWAGFVTALNVSLRWMRGKWMVMIFFGAIGGPLAYMSAEKLGAVTLNNMPASYIALGLGWAILTPLLVMLSQRFDGYQHLESKLK
jgi:hypothetical protein